jgi:hypothetical protein
LLLKLTIEQIKKSFLSKEFQIKKEEKQHQIVLNKT